jgi:tetratricopeptide (TPR) repeat protein
LKKLSAVGLFLLLLAFSGISANTASLDSLDYYISMKQSFDESKNNHIAEISKKIASNTGNNLKLYNLYDSLFEEYSSYIYDSAYVCVEKMLKISSDISNRDKIVSSKVKLGFCFFSSGMFKEAFDILNSVSVTGCSNETKMDFYITKSRLYYDLADYNNSPDFRKKYHETGNRILDSAIVLLPENSSRFWASVGLKHMKSGNYANALDALHKMIDTKDYSEHDLAIATSSIAYILSLQGKKTEAKEYLVRAAIADIKSSTKETVALRALAQLLFEEKDISRAVHYIRCALDDASFYNARHRRLEIGNILPIIEEERLNMIRNQRDEMVTITIIISVLFILLVIALFIIWKSFKNLKIAKQAIQDTNHELTEANKIKDEYIGYFFNQNSEFIEKMSEIQKWVVQKVVARQYDDLRHFSQNFDIQKERKAMFERFDRIFLKLFPDFVEKFNSLLKPEEHIQMKKDEILNTDLRIYALIRLGINDSEKIAQFLDYSVNTIYAYKTKIKAKALASGEDFKSKIMEIKSI